MGKRAEWDNPQYGNSSWDNTSQEAMWRQETSRYFHSLMDAAMMTSFYKYGALADAYPEKIDAIESMELRLKKYILTGNAEYLVDVANFAMIEFMHPEHPTAHYKPTDVEGSPGRVAHNPDYEGKPNQLQNNQLLEKDERF